MKMRLFLAVGLAALLVASATAQPKLKTAVFAGGCFWSIEKAFDAAPGVTAAVSGYSGGASKNPTYENHRGHLEAVRVTYNPTRTTYARLVDYFFHNIDPTDSGGQICDRGHSYTTAVFVADSIERQVAERVKGSVARTLRKQVATDIRSAATFWNAEAYHQDFAKNNPAHYEAYRIGCGRDRALKAVWGDR